MPANRAIRGIVFLFASSAAHGQPSQISYLNGTICCMAPDGRGNIFVVSSQFSNAGARASTVLVAKLDSSGRIVSTFPVTNGQGGIPAAAAVDPSGNLWIVGTTTAATSTNSPTLGLILKLNSDGNQLLSSATFGGQDPTTITQIQAIAFDAEGNLYVAGHTAQLDFPLTKDAFISAFPTLPAPPGSALIPHAGFGFLAKFAQAAPASPPYSLVYSTLLGGLSLPNTGGFPPLPMTDISALAVDADGIATVAGFSTAGDFPATKGAYKTQFEGNFTPNVFVTRFNSQASGLLWSTFLGVGSSSSPVSGLAVDSNGNVLIAGVTTQADFPVTAGAVQSQFTPGADTFVAKLDPAGAHLLFSTLYGAVKGSPSAPRLDSQGNLWITESVTDASSVPLAPGTLTLGSAVISELASDGSSVVFSELIPNGMVSQDLALNLDGTLTAAGANGILLRVPAGPPAGVSPLGVADSAGLAVTKSIAPGEYLTIYGDGLGPAAGVSMQLDQNGRAATSLAGTDVTIGGIPAPLLYVSEHQINALVPYGITPGQAVTLQVTTAEASSSLLSFDVVRAQPTIFTVLNADGSANSRSNPAPGGSTVSAFVSGAGVLNTSLPDGAIASLPAPAPALPAAAVVSYGIGGFFGFNQQTLAPTYSSSIPGGVVNMLRVDIPVTGLPCTVCTLAVQLGSAPSPYVTSYGAASPGVPLYIGN